MHASTRVVGAEDGGESQASLHHKQRTPKISMGLIPGPVALWRLRKRTCHSWDSSLQFRVPDQPELLLEPCLLKCPHPDRHLH